jgi:lipopolysaccharide transport system ATP-binding protein
VNVAVTEPEAPAVVPDETAFAIQLLGLTKVYRGAAELPEEPEVARMDEDDLDDGVDETDAEPEGDRATPNLPPRYGLRDVTLDVRAGSSVGIIGPNGAGKTTLLKILGRVTPPTAGRAILRGRVAPVMDAAGNLIQADLSAASNVRLLARFFGVPKDVVERRLEAVLDFAGLHDPKLPMKRYSRGHAKRLAFSVGLNLEPDILLADEAFAVGDLEFRERCAVAIHMARRAGLTILYASHDLDSVRDWCDHALWLEDGAVVLYDDVETVVAAYERARSPQPRGSGKLGPEPAAVAEHADQSEPPQKQAKRGFNADVAILAGGLFDAEGRPLDELPADTHAQLRILLDVATRGVSVQCTTAFLDEARVAARAVQPSSVNVRPGVQLFSADLPPGALRAGTYRARVGAWVHRGETRSALVRHNAFTVRVPGPAVAESSLSPEAELRLELAWTHGPATSLAG